MVTNTMRNTGWFIIAAMAAAMIGVMAGAWMNDGTGIPRDAICPMAVVVVAAGVWHYVTKPKTKEKK